VRHKPLSAFKSDIKVAKKIRLPWWGGLCLVALAFSTCLLFGQWGRLELVLPILNSIFVLGFVVVLKWKMRAHAWFWIAMAIFAALHTLLISLIPWTTKWIAASAIAGIDTIDFCAMLAVLSVVGSFLERRNTPSRRPR
jgi:hypothetical protein